MAQDYQYKQSAKMTSAWPEACAPDSKILSIEYGDDVLSTESLLEIAKYLKHSLYLSFRILQLSQILSTFVMNDIKMSER